jgi:hypothetical protein
MEIARSGADATISGWGRPFALSAGFALLPNLIVFGEFYSAQIRKPTSYTRLVDSDLLAFGPGVTYYLMPSNVFASCSLLVAQLGYRDATPLDWRYGTNIGSNWGLAGRWAVGKELWASSNWGLGIAGELVLGRMRAPDVDSTLTIKGFSMIASASFN